MTPVEFLFAILARWVPMDPERRQQLKNKADAWWNGINLDEPKEYKGWELTFKKLFSDWKYQIGLAVLFVPASNWFREWANPTKDVDDDDDEL